MSERAVPSPRPDPVRGLLEFDSGAVQLARYLPSPDLALHVEHYWRVSWNLHGGAPVAQETLPYPSVHLVFEAGGPRVYGVPRGKFTRVLEGSGRVFAVKFRPAAFHSFLGAPLAVLTDRVVDAADVFGSAVVALHERVVALEADAALVEAAEAFLRARRPARDPTAVALGRVVDHLLLQPDVLKVDEVAARLRVPPRALQRLFRRYVGVSPKWVIKRGRLHEATDRIASTEVVDWPALAQELGYFDQAHFIHDFSSVVGRTPAEFKRRLSD